MSETCSCTKDNFFVKTNCAGVEGNRRGFLCFFFVLFVFQSDLMYFDIPQRKKPVHRSNEGNNDYDHS